MFIISLLNFFFRFNTKGKDNIFFSIIHKIVFFLFYNYTKSTDFPMVRT